jgi:hypothetical protein
MSWFCNSEIKLVPVYAYIWTSVTDMSRIAHLMVLMLLLLESPRVIRDIIYLFIHLQQRDALQLREAHAV